MRKRFMDLKIGDEFKFLEKFDDVPENQIWVKIARAFFKPKGVRWLFIISHIGMIVDSLESEPGKWQKVYEQNGE